MNYLTTTIKSPTAIPDSGHRATGLTLLIPQAAIPKSSPSPSLPTRGKAMQTKMRRG